MDVITRRKADGKFMHAAIAEARKAIFTHPNPRVGAVVVKSGRIIGRGYHHAAGCPHAEIEAILSLRHPSSAKGATLYITLEPCSTQGRTPPCTEAILQAGFSRVVYGAVDPNPNHAGRAKSILGEAGLAVTEGIMAQECTDLNTAWNKWISTSVPYVTAKVGMTLDGRISSPPEGRWITNAASRTNAMVLRSQVQAILIGGETLRVDNPRLTLRQIKGIPQPWRVIWSRSGKLPKEAHLFTDAHKDRTLVFTGTDLRQVLHALGQLGVAHVLIEGGGRVHGEAFDKGLVDEVSFYLAPLLAGGPVPAVGGLGVNSSERAIRLADVSYRQIGSDVLVSARVIKN